MFDVAIIGAGLAGLTCAQQLNQAGYRVVVLEKSRGVGGRIATRRIQETLADHGVPGLQPQGRLVGQLIERLSDRGILQRWIDSVEPLPSVTSVTQSAAPLPLYTAPSGMTAVAKFLATDLEIWFNHQVDAIAPMQEHCWHLTVAGAQETPHPLTARAVVVAIPAPQALMLLTPLAETDLPLPSGFFQSLRSVEYNPCLSAIAAYSCFEAQGSLPLATQKACTFANDSHLAWIGLDSSKRPNPQTTIFVLHSTAEFAKPYLDVNDLNPAGRQLLSRAAQLLSPELDTPDWFQVHRWRYAFPHQPFNQDCLNAGTSVPLICCGDWCGGNLIESAMNSGLAVADQIKRQLHQS